MADEMTVTEFVNKMRHGLDDFLKDTLGMLSETEDGSQTKADEEDWFEIYEEWASEHGVDPQ